MNAKTYALALLKALRETPEREHERLIAHFISILKTRRHERLLPAIVTSFERYAQKQTEYSHVTFARESDMQLLKGLVEKDIQTLSAHTLPTQVRTDHNLIGGYVVTAKGQRLDHSHRRTLIDMYHTLIGQV